MYIYIVYKIVHLLDNLKKIKKKTFLEKPKITKNKKETPKFSFL